MFIQILNFQQQKYYGVVVEYHIAPTAFFTEHLYTHSHVAVLHCTVPQEYLPDLLYVGETESVRQRLRQHRDAYRAKGYSFSAAVLAVRDKSAARRVETTLINNLKVRGFDIENDTDSKHVLFSTSSSSSRK